MMESKNLEPRKPKTLSEYKGALVKLEEAYDRQEALLEKMKGALADAQASTANAIRKERLRRDREKKAEQDRTAQAARITTRSSSAAATALCGYYLIADELDALWIVSESFTR